ncbi:MAG: RlmE family RNA methyltransferase [Rhodobacteraceae bacterium]|nr:RlmE family RNA methyltransferase [Paracoccaceae bacterium]
MGKDRNSANSRKLTVRVRKAKGRRTSSHRWLNRQLNDPFVARARREGMRSRAAFKLEELDDKFRLFRPGFSVVDLGGAPGGWAQVAASRVNSNGCVPGAPKGRVISVDLKEMEPIDGVEFLQLDLRSEQAASRILQLSHGCVDAVISDMAEPATGHTKTDHLRIMALCEAAAQLSCDLLNGDGGFVAKVLAGGTEHRLLAELRSRFRSVRHAKPKASRSESSEKYVVALGYFG